MTRKFIKPAVFFLMCAICSSCAARLVFAGDRDHAFDILDAWTCVRWGEDNIAWVVHYPEELVDPWVRSEAEKQKLRPEQMEELRKSFAEELRIGSATAVLLSVYAYGPSPTNLSPMAKNIVLIDSSGKRVSPMVFEKKLDDPITGLLQGFVFFPLQTDNNFKIEVRGLVPNRETSFIFPGTVALQAENVIATAPEASVSPPARQAQPKKEVVVKIPTKKESAPKKTAPKTPPSVEPEPEIDGEAEIIAPTAPIAPPPEPGPEPEIMPLPEESADLPPEAPVLTPQQVLDAYLKAWIDGDTDGMYSLLSDESRGRISKELFAREIASGNFRGALRSGYKVNWVGDSAKVTVARKVLFVRTLETKQINFVMENGSARVSW
jgi:hypothetical protein